MIIRTVRAFVILTLAVGISLAEKRGLLPTDFYKEVTVSNVAVSPSGDMVAFTVMTIVEDQNKRHNEVWAVRLANGKPDGEPFRLTDPTQDSTDPKWSPDGSVLAFSSRRGKDKNSSWFLRMAQPGGEAFHIEGVTGSPTWSPDGQWIAFTRTLDEDEDSDSDANKRKGWIASDSITTTLDSKRFDGRVITSTRYKRDGVLTLRPDPLIQPKRQLFVVPAQGGEARQITDLPFNVGGIEWSRDSRTILFVGDEKEDDEMSRDLTSDIYAVSRDGGEPRKLTSNPGSENSAAWSPTRDQLAFLFTSERGAETDLMLVAVDTAGNFSGAPRNLTPNWDLRPANPTWTPDGQALRFGSEITGNVHVFEIRPDSGPSIRQVTSGDRQLVSTSMDQRGLVMAFAATDATRPTELFVSGLDGAGEVRASRFNDDWLEEVDLQPAEQLTWSVDDGSTIEGWVVKPVGYDPGLRYPMILKIHGGPHGAYGNTFFRTFHVLSAAGFFVLYPNPRGSTGYGHAFTYATRGKWGEMDREDYLKGVDAALQKYPAIDPARLGVSGGSYGGYMTNWLSSTTDRFAAAVTSRSITNWESWYGTSDAQGLTEYEFLGTPWEQRETYRRLSPISYVENVTAPTLIIHSEQDYRTPIGDGEQWFMALKKRGVPVEMIRYPRSSHGLSRTGEPWLLVDRLERIRSWFVHWLIEEPATAAGGSQ